MLAENRLLKEELNAFKAGLSATELQRQEEACLSRELENIIQHSDTESPPTRISILQDAGVDMKFRPNIHQKFAVIDQKIVWYGSINLLSFGSAEESVMRLESPNIANELIKSVHN